MSLLIPVLGSESSVLLSYSCTCHRRVDLKQHSCQELTEMVGKVAPSSFSPRLFRQFEKEWPLGTGRDDHYMREMEESPSSESIQENDQNVDQEV